MSPFAEQLTDEVTQMLDAGLTTQEICEALGRQYESIRRVLHRWNSPVKNRLLAQRKHEYEVRRPFIYVNWTEKSRCSHGAWSSSGECEHGPMNYWGHKNGPATADVLQPQSPHPKVIVLARNLTAVPSKETA